MGVIVVGVDGSEPATQAALTAARLAVGLGSELRVVCAYGDYEVERVRDDRDLVFTSVEPATEVAEQTIGRLRNAYPSLTASAQAAGGKPAEALLEVAASVDAEMIVVGNKRVQGAARILGSIATEVARKAQCDLHIAYTYARR
ncbi:universal stress protein [Nocardioides sp. Kera G14]|uniref:universal stress protein n=1 Tax=Nocardioides sp. Kera G14 TaxID=2884264 RepID=UPI001D123168|nr:universal stress protein [Nocardioides sp. Kera G14]UDY25186.1 universal stress protein [Nocardioides sp. Kera G14]